MVQERKERDLAQKQKQNRETEFPFPGALLGCVLHRWTEMCVRVYLVQC